MAKFQVKDGKRALARQAKKRNVIIPWLTANEPCDFLCSTRFARISGLLRKRSPMPKFVWTTKDKSGAQVVRVLTAATIEESKSLLQAEGCTDLELKEDEILAAVAESFTEKVEIFGEEIKVSPEERFKHYGKPPPTILRTILESLAKEK